MSYIGLNTQYLGGKAGGKQQDCCHILPPTLEVSDVNYEIVREREELRMRIAQLEQNHFQELEILKNNIIAECETTLEKEIREAELKYTNKVTLLTQQIESLQKKSAQQSSAISSLQSEAIVLNENTKTLNDKLTKQKKIAADLEAKHANTINDMNEAFDAKLAKELAEQENMLNNSFEREKNRMLANAEDLKNKISEFQVRMKQVAAELEKIRAELHAKKISSDEWRFKFESLEKSSEIEIYQLRREVENLQRIPPQRNLQYEVKELKEKLDRKKAKLVKLRDEVRVRTETIIVEKPVEVEKIVEVVKYIPIEKIVKEIQPAKQPIVIQECGVSDKSDNVIKDYQREIEDRDRTVDRLNSEIEELTISTRQTQQQYEALNGEFMVLQSERENLLQQVSSYNQYIHELEVSYSHKNQELMNKVQQIYVQMMQGQKNPGKIVVRVGKDGKSSIEQANS